MELLRRRGLHIAVVVILIVALGATAYPGSLVENLGAAATAIRAGRPELALPALRNAISLEPEMPELYLRAAQGAFAADAADQAADLLNQLSERDLAMECLLLGAEISEGGIEGALQKLAELECPAQAEQLLHEATRQVEDGDLEAAVEILEDLAATRPVTPGANEVLGTLYATQDPERALSHLRLAIDLEPRTLRFTNDLIAVIEAARQEQDTAFTLAQVGQALAREGQWLLAALAFENALAEDPDYTEARAYYGLALDRSGGDGLPQLEIAVAEAPQAPLPWVLLGKHWLIGGEPARAIEAYEQAAALAPSDPLIAVDLGAAYAAAGDLPAAKVAYEYATDLNPSDAALWSMMAQFSLDYEIELNEFGLPAARRAVVLEPRDAAALARLGYTHYLLGNWTLAERFVLEALEKDHNLASGHYHLGLLRLASGDLNGARVALASAIALDPEGRYGSLALRSLENLNQ